MTSYLDIDIRFYGGPLDGEPGAPTELHTIEVTRLPPAFIESGPHEPPPAAQIPSYRHLYRRNMAQPWRFEYQD